MLNTKYYIKITKVKSYIFFYFMIYLCFTEKCLEKIRTLRNKVNIQNKKNFLANLYILFF